MGLDQFSCLYVMKAVNSTRDPMTMVQPVYLVSMLEYSMVMGYDWWDVLASLRSGKSDFTTSCFLNCNVKLFWYAILEINY